MSTYYLFEYKTKDNKSVFITGNDDDPERAALVAYLSSTQGEDGELAYEDSLIGGGRKILSGTRDEMIHAKKIADRVKNR